MAKTVTRGRSTRAKTAVKTKKSSILTNESERFLRDYINNASPVGFETWGQKLWLEYLGPFVDETYVDPYGTAVGIVNPGKNFRVVIEAHADEISWFVNYVTTEGLIYLKRNGGVDHQTAPASRVYIHGKIGPVKAVFGWPAIHVRKIEQDKAPAIETIFLDCGAASRQEVEDMGIHVGSVVTFDDELMVMNEKFLVGRAAC